MTRIFLRPGLAALVLFGLCMPVLAHSKGQGQVDTASADEPALSCLTNDGAAFTGPAASRSAPGIMLAACRTYKVICGQNCVNRRVMNGGVWITVSDCKPRYCDHTTCN